MNRLIAAAFLLSTFTGVANAMPLAPADSPPNASIIRVAGGCGPGFHRGPYERCVPNRAAVIVERPAVVVVEPRGRGCPVGFFWRNGRCRPI